MPPRQAPGSGNGATLDTIGTGADAGGNRRRAHSTDAFGDTNNHHNSNNPFGTTDETNEDNGTGGGNNSSNNNNHRRSNSGNWWREEIVDEGQDKGKFELCIVCSMYCFETRVNTLVVENDL